MATTSIALCFTKTNDTERAAGTSEPFADSDMAAVLLFLAYARYWAQESPVACNEADFVDHEQARRDIQLWALKNVDRPRNRIWSLDECMSVASFLRDTRVNKLFPELGGLKPRVLDDLDHGLYQLFDNLIASLCAHSSRKTRPANTGAPLTTAVRD